MPRNPLKKEEEKGYCFPKKVSLQRFATATPVFRQGKQVDSQPWINPNCICPECKVQFNQTDFRRTKDTCGHVKCRSCLVKSDDGCFTCERLEEEISKVVKKKSPLSSSSSTTTFASLFKNPPPPPAHCCTHCKNGNFDLKRDLEVHLIKEHGIEMYHACAFCPKIFIYKKDLERHAVTHGEHPFKCTMCSWEFLKKITLERHIRNIHKTTDEVASELANQVEAEYLKTIPLPSTPEENEDSDSPHDSGMQMVELEIEEEADQTMKKEEQDLATKLESMSNSLRMCLNVK